MLVETMNHELIFVPKTSLDKENVVSIKQRGFARSRNTSTSFLMSEPVSETTLDFTLKTTSIFGIGSFVGFYFGSYEVLVWKIFLADIYPASLETRAAR